MILSIRALASPIQASHALKPAVDLFAYPFSEPRRHEPVASQFVEITSELTHMRGSSHLMSITLTNRISIRAIPGILIVQDCRCGPISSGARAVFN